MVRNPQYRIKGSGMGSCGKSLEVRGENARVNPKESVSVLTQDTIFNNNNNNIYDINIVRKIYKLT